MTLACTFRNMNLADEHQNPSETPGLEIERKYLLDRRPDLPPDAQVLHIEQGYLAESEDEAAASADRIQGRLRRTRYADGTVRHTHTIKRGQGLVREETNRDLTRDEFERLWERTAQRRLTKTRHSLPRGEVLWVIDVYEEFDIVIAEVELPTPDTEVVIPDWLAPHVVREVTDEPAFRNYELALMGIKGTPPIPRAGRAGR